PNGISRLIRIGEPPSSPNWRDNHCCTAATAMVKATPHATPTVATHKSVSAADSSEKQPDNAAAPANAKHTRPDASLSSDSPSRKCINRFGTGVRAAIVEIATGSV